GHQPEEREVARSQTARVGQRRATLCAGDLHGRLPIALPDAHGAVGEKGRRARAERADAESATLTMLHSNLDATSPILCIVLGALAAMAAEAFRRKGERMPIGWFGVIVLIGAGLSSAFLWDRQLVAFDVIVADNFGLFVSMVLVVVGILTVMFSS